MRRSASGSTGDAHPDIVQDMTWRSYLLPLCAATFAVMASQARPIPVAFVPEIVALLRMNTEEATFLANVRTDGPSGYRVEIDCVAGCVSKIAFRQKVDDSPLGLFSRDQNDLIFSVWSAGSAYRVRVWQVGTAGVREVAELSSRGRPDFASDPSGRPVIRTFDRPTAAGTLAPTLWVYRDGFFKPAKRTDR